MRQLMNNLFYADTLGLKTVDEGILASQKALDPQYWRPAPLRRELVLRGGGGGGGGGAFGGCAAGDSAVAWVLRVSGR